MKKLPKILVGLGKYLHTSAVVPQLINSIKTFLHDEVFGVFHHSLTLEKNNDEKLLVVNGADLAKEYETYVFQRILKNETLVRPV